MHQKSYNEERIQHGIRKIINSGFFSVSFSSPFPKTDVHKIMINPLVYMVVRPGLLLYGKITKLSASKQQCLGQNKQTANYVSDTLTRRNAMVMKSMGPERAVYVIRM
jgi:hypothetical protein